jgi:hypothetical protein
MLGETSVSQWEIPCKYTTTFGEKAPCPDMLRVVAVTVVVSVVEEVTVVVVMVFCALSIEYSISEADANTMTSARSVARIAAPRVN